MVLTGLAIREGVFPGSKGCRQFQVTFRNRVQNTADELYYVHFVDGDLVRRFGDRRGPCSRRAFLSRMAQTVLRQQILQTITAPVLLLWGENDGMTPIANAADYQSNLNNVQFVSLPDSGHVPQEETPQESLPVLQGFLQRVSPP